ncbi:MAG: Coq4 family protein [Alphaproteobacteria bacterium]
MDNPQATSRRRMQPLVAWKAMQKLLADKEDTVQVFKIISALGGGELKRNLKRFAQTEVGAQVLHDRREILHALADRDALAAMPAGSLGRAYLDFVGAENLTADGLVDASREGAGQGEGFTADENLLRRRVRDSHDLWHVLNGYGRDEIGELSLLAFTYAQLRNRGVRFIIWMGLRKSRKVLPGVPVDEAVREGFRLGRETAWLAALDWEAMLPRPIEEVRTLIGRQRPIAYERAVAIMREAGVQGYEQDPLSPLPQAA